MHAIMKTIGLTVFLTVVTICGSQQDKRSDGDGNIVLREWPYLQNEAEFWSFDNQIQENLKGYSLNVQNYTKYYFIEKEQNNARLPTFSKKLSIKGSAFELQLRNGRLKGLDGIKVSYEYLRAYEGLEVSYTSEMTFLNDIKVIHDYSIMKGGTGYRGKIEGLIEGLKYYAYVRFNLKTQEVKVEFFDLRCYSRIELQNITNIPSNRAQIINEIRKAAMELYSTAILADAKTLTRTALGEGFAGSSIAEFIPKFNYSIDYLKGVKRFDNMGYAPQCPADFKERKEPTVIEINNSFILAGVVHDGGRSYMKFIQNEAEMSAYLRLLNDSLKYFVDDFVTNMVQDLTDRKLTKIKLPHAGIEIVTLRDGKVQKSTLHLTNGWITNPFNFESVGVTLVQIVYNKMMFTWRMNLLDTLEYISDYEIDIWGGKLNGTVTVKVDILPFLIRHSTSFSNFDLKIMNVLRECQLVNNIEVTGLGEMASGLTGYLQYNLKHSFGSEVLDSVYQELLVQGIKAAKYRTDLKSYLPKWNYDRDYSEDKDADENAWEMKVCNDGELEKLRNKTYNYSYEAELNVNPVPFIQNEIELKAFAKELRKGLDKYIQTILHEASSIIVIQDLKKFKVAGRNVTLDYKGPLGNSWSGELSLNNTWIEDISDVTKWPKIDYIKFNSKYILFTADVQLWGSLMLSSDFTVKLDKEQQQKGNLSSVLFEFAYLLAARVDSNSPVVDLDEMQFKCLRRDPFVEVDGLEGPTQFHLANEISRITKETVMKEAMETAQDLFRRALEDAISNNNIRNFLPKWNYRRTFNQSEVQKPIDYVKPCDDQGPRISTLYKIKSLLYGDDKLIAYEDFHKILRTEGLRRSMRLTNPERFASYANQLWNHVWRATMDYFASMELSDRELMFVAKDENGLEHSVTLKMSGGRGEGITWVERFQDSDVAYAENDTVIIVERERVRHFWITFDYKLFVSGELKGNGTIKGVLKGIDFLLKLRLYFNEKRFVVEDYDIFCFKEYSLTFPGITEENKWLQKQAEDQVTSQFKGPVLDDVAKIRGQLFKDAQPAFEVRWYFPVWMVYESSYAIAISNETDPKRIEERIHLLQNCNTSIFNNTDASHEEYQGNIAYIKTEAQWWYFDREIKNTMRVILNSVIFNGRRSLNEFSLNMLPLSNYNRNFTTKIPGGGVDAGEMRFLNGVVGDLSAYVTIKDLDANSNLKLENFDVIFTSYVKFEDLKFTGQVEASVADTFSKGSAEGKVKDLSYMFRVRLNLKTKAMKLEEMKLTCIGGIQVTLDGFSDAKPQTYEKISGILKDLFLGPILDDIGRVIHVIIDINVNEIHPGRIHEPSWNYDLDYTKEEKPGGLVVDDRYKLCDPPS